MQDKPERKYLDDADIQRILNNAKRRPSIGNQYESVNSLLVNTHARMSDIFSAPAGESKRFSLQEANRQKAVKEYERCRLALKTKGHMLENFTRAFLLHHVLQRESILAAHKQKCVDELLKISRSENVRQALEQIFDDAVLYLLSHGFLLEDSNPLA